LTKYFNIVAMGLGLVSTVLSPALAAEGDWQVRLRGVNHHPRQLGDSDTLTIGGVATATNAIALDNDIVPELDVVYNLHPRLGVELSLLHAEQDLRSRGGLGTLGSGAKLMNAESVSPSLTLQYLLLPNAAVQPYVGVGVSYTGYFGEDPTAAVVTAFGASEAKLDDAWALALQAGADVPLVDQWVLNLDLKYIDRTSDMTLDTAASGRIATELGIDPVVVGIGIGRRF
jgi:outer membrane protein